MKRFIQSVAVGALSLWALSSWAIPPKQLVTHNNTDFESNAYIDGTIASQHPTKAHSDGRVFWTAVRMACFGHTVNGRCLATIMMASDTPNPIELGRVTLDLDTGDIMPKQISAQGFTLTVNGPGETTLSTN
jgi:hypothetical protein